MSRISAIIAAVKLAWPLLSRAYQAHRDGIHKEWLRKVLDRVDGTGTDVVSHLPSEPRGPHA
jgi:hypothetical protein